MSEFLNLIPRDIALEKFFLDLPKSVNSETIKTVNALGRFSTDEISSKLAFPMFRRSTVDGYAVKSHETFGASNSIPALLNISGEVLMGEDIKIRFERNSCVQIHTGGMLPAESDAVVMLEDTQTIGDNEIEIFKAVSPGENVIQIGEDIREGEIIIAKDQWIRPQEIGGLLSTGIVNLKVHRKPTIGIISSGDELVTPTVNLELGKINEINSYTLSLVLENSGGNPRNYGIVNDTKDELLIIAQKALRENDMVIFTAGSSASQRDLTANVIKELGDPGILVHGINLKPGKPTILAICDNKPVIGLPGNPVSAFVITLVVVRSIMWKFMGIENPPKMSFIQAKLETNVSSKAGREDWVPVRLIGTPIRSAEPIFGKSNLIFTLVNSDGLMRIPPELTGVRAGELVEVMLF